jgi:hypothetical protein
MRVIGKLVVLAFAGFGMYKAWELGNAKLIEVRQHASDAKARIEPALRETEDTVHSAAEEVNASMHAFSQTVADSVAGKATDSRADVSSRI